MNVPTVVWREVEPDVIRSAQSPRDAIGHAVIEGHRRARCGMMPRRGWQQREQRASGRRCTHCQRAVRRDGR